jgi:hypothetical protein
MTRPLLAALAAMLLVTTAAQADAITYSGTIGSKIVVVELTEPADGPLLGRFAWLEEGVDIPLHPLGGGGKGMVLAQELACDEARCIESEDGIFDPPFGARWTLRAQPDGGLVGTWAGDGVVEPVILRPVGQRSYDRYDTFSYQSFLAPTFGEPIGLGNHPYLYRKMLVELEQGQPVETGTGAQYRMVVDPRTKFAFPRVAYLPGGGSTAAVNQALDEIRWETNMIGLSCLGLNYLSAGWRESGDFGQGTLGYVDEEHTSVDYLSPTVMTIVQGGSISCGGQSPLNHIDYFTIDVRTGEWFDLSRVFSGWIPTEDGKPVPLDAARETPFLFTWKPDAALVAFVRANMPSQEYALECLAHERVPDHLDISFAPGDVAVFRIDGLDSTELPCEGELFSMPLARMREFLAPGAEDYFPSLR